MHLCGWHSDGKTRCNEPASKYVQFEGKDNGEEFDIQSIWLCDQHYSDPTLVIWWKNMNVRPIF